MKILLTLGPIPARLDSVKYITNRFHGGLALKTAKTLATFGHEITLVHWRHAKIDSKNDLAGTSYFPVILVDDVHDYYRKALDFEADAYVLAAAVANLGPVTPMEGKFPSHNYKEGDVFPIDFTIMPRVIDAIKKRYPRSTLIGYKLFDGTDAELVEAARHTLEDSRANLVFANHPDWAKERKIAITSDGAAFNLSFNEHIRLIDRLVNERFYRTELCDCPYVDPELQEHLAELFRTYPRTTERGQVHGTFALRTYGDAFATTSRGHRSAGPVFVAGVDHDALVVQTSGKATLNAPLLHKVLVDNPGVNIVIHDHRSLYHPIQPDYQFPGSTGDLLNCPKHYSKFVIDLPHHGYLAGFPDMEAYRSFMEEIYG